MKKQELLSYIKNKYPKYAQTDDELLWQAIQKSRPDLAQYVVPEGYDPNVTKLGHAKNQFIRGAGSAISGIPKSMGMIHTALTPEEDNALDTTAWEVGDWIDKKIEGIAPINPEYEGSFLISTLPQAFGSTVGFMLAGLLTGGKAWGAALAGAAVTSPSMYEEAYQQTQDINKSFRAGLEGAAWGALEGAPIGRLFGRVSKGVAGTVKREVLRKSIAQGLEEGTQELLQTGLENWTAKRIYDDQRDLFQGVGEGGAAGYITGFTLAFLGLKIRSKVNQGDTDPYVEQEGGIETTAQDPLTRMAEGVAPAPEQAVKAPDVSRMSPEVKAGMIEQYTRKLNDIRAGREPVLTEEDVIEDAKTFGISESLLEQRIKFDQTAEKVYKHFTEGAQGNLRTALAEHEYSKWWENVLRKQEEYSKPSGAPIYGLPTQESAEQAGLRTQMSLMEKSMGDLRNIAKDLGIPYSGKNKRSLVNSILEKQSFGGVSPDYVRNRRKDLRSLPKDRLVSIARSLGVGSETDTRIALVDNIISGEIENAEKVGTMRSEGSREGLPEGQGVGDMRQVDGTEATQEQGQEETEIDRDNEPVRPANDFIRDTGTDEVTIDERVSEESAEGISDIAGEEIKSEAAEGMPKGERASKTKSVVDMTPEEIGATFNVKVQRGNDSGEYGHDIIYISDDTTLAPAFAENYWGDKEDITTNKNVPANVVSAIHESFHRAFSDNPQSGHRALNDLKEAGAGHALEDLMNISTVYFIDPTTKLPKEISPIIKSWVNDVVSDRGYVLKKGEYVYQKPASETKNADKKPVTEPIKIAPETTPIGFFKTEVNGKPINKMHPAREADKKVLSRIRFDNINDMYQYAYSSIKLTDAAKKAGVYSNAHIMMNIARANGWKGTKLDTALEFLAKLNGFKDPVNPKATNVENLVSLGFDRNLAESLPDADVKNIIEKRRTPEQYYNVLKKKAIHTLTNQEALTEQNASDLKFDVTGKTSINDMTTAELDKMYEFLTGEEFLLSRYRYHKDQLMGGIFKQIDESEVNRNAGVLSSIVDALRGILSDEYRLKKAGNRFADRFLVQFKRAQGKRAQYLAKWGRVLKVLGIDERFVRDEKANERIYAYATKDARAQDVTAKEKKIADRLRQLFDDIIAIANDPNGANLQIPFRENYFPQLAKEEVRSEIGKQLTSIRGLIAQAKDNMITTEEFYREYAQKYSGKTMLAKALNDIYEMTGNTLKYSQIAEALENWTNMQVIQGADVTDRFFKFVNNAIQQNARELGFEKKRTFDRLPDWMIDRNASRVAITYLRSMSNRVSLAEEFGANNEKFKFIYKNLHNTDPRLAKVIQQLMAHQSGTLAINQGYTGKLKDAFDWLIGFEFATKIGSGLAVIPQFTQYAISVMPQRGFFKSITDGLAIIKDKSYKDYIVYNTGVLSDSIHEKMLGVVLNDKYAINRWGRKFAIPFNWANRGLAIWSAASFERHMLESVPKYQLTGDPKLKQEIIDFGWNPDKQMFKYTFDDLYNKSTEELTNIAREELVLNENIKTREQLIKQIQTKVYTDEFYQAMHAFSVENQLMGDPLKEPSFFKTPYLVPLLILKRFQYKQVGLSVKILKQAWNRGDYMQILRFSMLAPFGGMFVMWARDLIKQILGGEKNIRTDTTMLQRYFQSLGEVGAMGIVTDVMAIDKISDLPRALDFAFTPVIISDIYTMLDSFEKVMANYERYGDVFISGKEALRQGTRIMGTIPRELAKQTYTDAERRRRVSYKKGQIRTEVLDLMIDGKPKRASVLIERYNKAYPENPITASDVSAKEMRRRYDRKKEMIREKGGITQ